nr:uncharacterized protein LOC111511740 [Leptinotarsa decemlineata]
MANFNFKCCKQKTAPSYYVCIKCISIFHKACALRNSRKVSFIENHKVICCETENLSYKDEILEEKSLLEESVLKLTQEQEVQNTYIEKLKKDAKFYMDEALNNEKELSELIEKQKKHISEAKEQIKQLTSKLEDVRNENSKLQEVIGAANGKQMINIGCQTILPNRKQIACQTEQTQTEKKASATQSLEDEDFSKYKDQSTPSIRNDIPVIKSRMLIVAGSNGKDLANIVLRQSNKYAVQAIIKSNAPDDELIKTAVYYSSSFTRNDIVLIWTKILHLQLIETYIEKLMHTNPIIITRPYRYDQIYKNHGIYMENLAFVKAVFNRTNELGLVFECNSALRKTNYHTDGFTINRIGKWYLMQSLLRHEDKHLTGINKFMETCCVSEEKENEVVQTYSKPDAETNNKKLSASLENNTISSDILVKNSTVEGTNKQDNFLYPRLSQLNLQQV